MTRSHRSFATRPAASLVAATRPLGRAALSCGLAGALSLGAAGAALASGHDSAPQAGADRGRAPGQASSAAAQQKPGDRRPEAEPQEAGPRQPAEATNRGSQQSSAAHQPRTSGPRTSAPQRTPAPQRDHDPRGNNGTIKVDGAAWDARVDNEPHTSCAFRVTLFGFDEGQTADITVTGVAPTGGGVLLHETAVPTSGDRAGGAAHDFDGATRVYTADDLGLGALTPHPQQGYHLKVAVDSLEAPGGAKQKVLWLEPCGAEAPVTQPETGGLEQGGKGTTPTTTEGPETTVAAPGTEGPATGADVPQRQSAAAVPAPAVLRAEAAFLESPTSPAQEAASPVASRPVQQASALPTGLAFTGAAGLELLALTGAAAAAAGAGLLVARRRASAQAG